MWRQKRTSGRALISRAGPNKDYDAAVDAAEAETDLVKRAALYIKANDIMMQDTVFIP